MMMDEPELTRPLSGRAAVSEAAHEDLDLYSVIDLEERIEQLQAEIGRTKEAIDKKRNGRAAADAFFSLGGN